MKKIFKILGIILGSLIVLCVLLWVGYYGYSYCKMYSTMHALKKPYIDDAKQSLGGESPMDVYQKFRKALKSDNTDIALQYIFESSREKYKEEFRDPERIKIYLDMPEELKEERISECTGEAFACEQTAVYYYEYEVKGEQKEFDLGDGYIGVHEPGIYKSHTNFIKNLVGKWQISELRFILN